MKISTVTFLIILLYSSLFSQDIQTKIDSIKQSITSLEAKKQELRIQETIINSKIDSLKNSLNNLINLQSSKGLSFTVKNNLPATFRLSPESGTNIVSNIPINTALELYPEYYNDFFKVKYNNTIGYVHKMYIDNIPFEASVLIDKQYKEITALERQRSKLEREQRLQKQAMAKDERAKRMEVKYGAKTSKKILQGKIWLGMTDSMALDSYGPPTDVNRTVTKYGVSEQWVYEREHLGNKYLYFDDGILTSWQD